MKIFSGFPSGKVQVTPLPDLFFSELCPAIDDLVELKVTLHIFWRLAHSKMAFLHMNELRGDRTLMQSLSGDGAPEQELMRALSLATERGTLLHLALEGEGDDLFFLNTDRGRRAFEKIASQAISPSPKHVPAETMTERPNIYMQYEQNIGMLTPMIVEELVEAENAYPPGWIADAFKIAVENNKRSWSYVRKILERWKTEGRTNNKKRDHWWNDEYDKYINR